MSLKSSNPCTTCPTRSLSATDGVVTFSAVLAEFPATTLQVPVPRYKLEREIFIDNLLVRVHWIIEMIVVEWPCAMGVGTPDFQVALYLPSQKRLQVIPRARHFHGRPFGARLLRRCLVQGLRFMV